MCLYHSLTSLLSVPEESWRPVPGYQGWYEVSDAGNVYALARAGAHGGLLRPQVNSAGYRFVRLHKYGRVRSRTVGSLVLEAFRGLSPGARAQHGDGGKLDDSLGNLNWA
jgi:NUMOD4 motif